MRRFLATCPETFEVKEGIVDDEAGEGEGLGDVRAFDSKFAVCNRVLTMSNLVRRERCEVRVENGSEG